MTVIDTVSYEFFLEHKNEKQNKNVLIVCKNCKKEAIVSWKSLQTRQRKYEAICNKCISHFSASNSLRGTYYGIKFESSYELGFIYACLKNGKNIKRCNIVIPYKKENEIHNYYPDFIIDNNIVEIKGYANDDVESKSLAAKKYCKKHNLNYMFLTFNDLLKIDNFIAVTSKEHLLHFDKEFLIVTKQPKTWCEKAIPKNDSIGFSYVVTKLSINEKRCDYILTKDFSEQFISTLYDKNNEKIEIMCYSNDEYELLKAVKRFNRFRHDTYFKRVDNMRSKEEREHISKVKKETWKNMPQKEKEMFSKKMSEAVKGEKNPNFGNKWTQEQKDALSKKRKENGKSLGELNGMYGKKGENAINGRKVYLCTLEGEVEEVFPSVKFALKQLNISRKKLQRYVDSAIPFNNHIIKLGQYGPFLSINK